MKLLLLDPVSGDPITQQVKAGDPFLPVLENAKTDRTYSLHLNHAGGQLDYRMQAQPDQKDSKVDDIEGCYTQEQDFREAGPIVAPDGAAFIALTVRGVKGRIKPGQSYSSKVIASTAIDVV
jgi:hypothetical protein